MNNKNVDEMLDVEAEELIVELAEDSITLTREEAREAIRKVAELLLVVHEEIAVRATEQYLLDMVGPPLSQTQ